MEVYDVIVIGGGMAGLTAAMYSSRNGLKTLVVTMDIGGQIVKASEVENYPGIVKATGAEIINNLYEQVLKFCQISHKFYTYFLILNMLT